MSSSLTANVFEKNGAVFDGWNTEPDGSGTSYSAQQQALNLVNPNETLNLYAMWEVGFTYYVRFNENGGTGTMGIQSLTYGSSFNLNTNTFTKTDRTFVRWNTEADGTGVDYEDGGVVKNLTKVEGDTIDLYAVWARDYYYKASEVYTGSNCDKTNIFLYSSANAGYDYEISFEISNIGSNPNQSTLMNAMYEVQPWPGILVRTTSNNAEYEVQMNGGSGNLTKKYKVNETNKFNIRRISGKIYVSVNDGAFELTRDHSNIATFDTVPVVFGCSVKADANLTEQRFFKGTLNNMRAFLFE